MTHRTKHKFFLILMAFVFALWPVLGVSGELKVSQGYVRTMPPGATSAAAYLTLENNTDNKMVLVGVSSNRAKQVMVHQNLLQGDMMRMHHVRELDIDAHSVFRFQPGGHHLMLTGLTELLSEGDFIVLNLQFKQGGVLEVSLPVTGMGAGMDMKGQHE